MAIIYVTGGARSGKSSFAEELANKREKRVYVATAIPFDDEMKFRVKLHQEQRGKNWLNIEAYRDLDIKLEESVSDEEVILVDCLTNMVTNIMIMERDIDWSKLPEDEFVELERGIIAEVDKLLCYADRFNGDMIIVSNEVGMGLVPEYHLGRRFRDIAGRVNQYVAKRADEAYLIVSGLSMKLK